MFEATIYNGDWIDKSKLVFPVPVEIYNNVIPVTPRGDAFRVLMVFSEPEPFRVSNAAVIEHQNKFDLILASDEEILHSCINAQLIIYGTTWINLEDIKDNDTSKKIFEVSFLCGAKNITQGHLLRQELWYRQKEIHIPKTFWISGALPVPSVQDNPLLPVTLHKKVLMFNSQFHIAIENVRSNHYFTEKLIDCFITKTIPIYWGCPNIEKYFDINGLYIVNNVDEIIVTCNKLREEDYWSRIEHIEHNYKECFKYCDNFSLRVKNAIDSFLSSALNMSL